MAKEYNDTPLKWITWKGRRIPIYAAKPLDDDIAGGPGVGGHHKTEDAYDEEALHDNAFGGDEPLSVAKPYNPDNHNNIETEIKQLSNDVNNIAAEVGNITSSHLENKEVRELINRIDRKISYADSMMHSSGNTEEIRKMITQLRGLKQKLKNGNYGK